MVTFNVKLPSLITDDEIVTIDFLDEVTGMVFNIEQHEMGISDDLNYTISLPLTIGSIVKYRYSRAGFFTSNEYASEGRPIRYRLYHVEAPGVVSDTISGWSDAPYSGDTGRIIGRAVDTSTSDPLPNILITAGGIHSFTASDGSFVLEGLPPGTHNLVAYALDGTYRTFQQGATIAANLTTPVPLRISKAPLVNIVFTVKVPENTMPAVPIRIAGNLSQFGNSFGDLSGGVNSLAVRMPELSTLPDGRLRLALSLPAGAYIRYKYTLGDGFWNAEHDLEGNLRLRHFIVPETNEVIEDVIDTWSDQKAGAILFNLTVPSNTPNDDHISIQFNHYDWTEPIPMWRLGEHRWVFILYSPFDNLGSFGYRYCRNDQCNRADDVLTHGSDSFGRVIETKDELQTIEDVVENWLWLDPLPSPVAITTTEVRQRETSFMAGVEFQSYYHPSWAIHLDSAFEDVRSLGANWVVITPTWTVTQLSPPIFEPVPGRDPLWFDMVHLLTLPENYDLKVALHPTPNFPISVDEWWENATKDSDWWTKWFENYRRFIFNFALLAESQQAEALILGGDWILPALPDGRLPNHTSSNVLEDAESRWLDLISEIRVVFSGKIMWALSIERGLSNLPDFLEEVDEIYLLWSLPLAEEPGSSEADLHMRAAEILDGTVRNLQRNLGNPLIIAIEYPSAEGSSTACLPDPLSTTTITCLDIELLAAPHPDISSIRLDLEEQALIYNSLLVAINERDFVNGFISRGYYPPAVLKDKSASIHGKPAGSVLGYWFPRILGLTSD
ncbi:MAG: carboxypeptidase regulatory-like domain-containing protein [Anaerolineales bacterium]|nr:carboxypeptidase regulatory-like domain-containing protein [Anaerolineales bacterium]